MRAHLIKRILQLQFLEKPIHRIFSEKAKNICANKRTFFYTSVLDFICTGIIERLARQKPTRSEKTH